MTDPAAMIRKLREQALRVTAEELDLFPTEQRPASGARSASWAIPPESPR